MQEIIGLTGNIATGKSVIRRMVANCGALEIDADMIAHRVMYPGGSAYSKIVAAFGKDILGDDGSISRRKLAEIVFNDLGKLKQLEAISHPAVTDAILARIRQSKQPLVIIEAIKLLEAGLDEICTAIWVSYASRSNQMERLIRTRKMTNPQAQSRITAQPLQYKKFAQADVVINTEGTFKSTWDRVQRSLNDTIQLANDSDEAHLNRSKNWKSLPINQIARDDIEAFWSDNSKAENRSLYEQLGIQMILPVLQDNQLSTFILWDNWNFTAALQNVLLDSQSKEIPSVILGFFEAHAISKQSEILLIPGNLVEEFNLSPASSGFQHVSINQITYPAWREACEKIGSNGEESVWIKILSQPFEQVVNNKDT